MQIFHIGGLIEPLPLEKLLIFANKGTLYEQSLPHNHSFSEHGGENSTCDSSLLKEPRVIALDFVQQKLHATVLNATCKGLLDVVINQILYEEASFSKSPTISVKQSTLSDKEQMITLNNDKSIFDATIMNEVLYHFFNLF